MQNPTTTPDEHHQRHVAVCAFPFGSHPAPLLLLINRIASNAPHVRFTFFSTQTSNAFIFKSLATTLPNIFLANLSVDGNNINPNPNPMVTIEGFLAMAPSSLRRGIEMAEKECGIAISCLISDAFVWFCNEIAEEKKVGWVSFWAAGPAALSAHFYTQFLRTQFDELLSSGGSEDRQIDCISGLSAFRFSDLPSGIVSGDLNSPFSNMLYNMDLVLPKATAVVINSFEELSPDITNDLKSKMNLLNVGPFPLASPSRAKLSDDQYGCLPWLDKQHEFAPRSVAYIAFGTVARFATPPPQEIAALAEALKDSKIPFIWSMNDATKVNLPSSFLEHIAKDEKLGMIVPWAPQEKILAHPATGVFVTHCGYNSVMESIGLGMPLISKAPFFGDQILNQRWIEFELKVGVGIEGGVFTKDRAMKVLDQVLSTKDGDLMRERLNVLKHKAEECVKTGGSSDKNFNALFEKVTSLTRGDNGQK